MTDTARIPVVWDGLPGLPGVSVFYSTTADATAAVAALVAFFTAIKTGFPTGLSWQVPSSGDTFNDASGVLTGSWSGASGSTVLANGGATVYAAGTGGYIRWQSSSIINGRRVKGRTFLCPIIGSKYDSNGTIDNTIVAGWQTAANTLVAANALRVWHRPPAGGTSGQAVLVTAALAPDRTTSLKSRRS